MSRKIQFLAIALFSFAVAGCATTGRAPQADVDALNSKISSLQSQLSEKDAEIVRMQNQMREEESARAQAESERKMLSDKLDSALSQLEGAESKKSAAYDSDLK